MLEYQKQNCDLTLKEGLDCYYKAFPETTEIFEDNKDSGTLLRDHDCTHVIFGPNITISLKHKKRLLELEKKLKERIKKIASVGRGALLAKERQKNHLKNATQALAKISGNDLEIISIHVRDALLSIDSLTSETDNEDILGIIFSKFCIGK